MVTDLEDVLTEIDRDIWIADGRAFGSSASFPN